MKKIRLTFWRQLIVLVLALFLCACKVTPPRNADVHNDINHTLMNSIYNNRAIDNRPAKSVPNFVNKELVPNLTVNLPHAKEEMQRFNLSVKDVPARDFFLNLVKDTNISVMVSPDITGDISLTLKNVTIPEVLEAVRDVYGYEYVKTAYGYDIYPRKMETHIFTVNYLDVVRTGKSDTTISSGQITQTIHGTQTNTNTSRESEVKPSSSIDTVSEADFWKNVKDTLDAMVDKKDGGSVIINADSGLVIVKAYPGVIRQIAKYLDDIQNIMERQVIIEAKVIEVQLSAQYQAGINWNVLGISQTGLKTFSDNLDLNPNADEGGTFKNIFSLDMHSGKDFSTVIDLLNAQGKVNVLSSPRIATVNNQKAVIKVGDDSFFVTNVESTTTTSTVTGETSQDIDFTPFFSGIALDVTPQINQNGVVTLHIHPIVSQVREEKKKFVVSGKEQDIPLAQSSIRESDSIVRAKNGQVIVIGGLMENRSADYQASTPGPDQLPKVGWLFKSPNRLSNKFELIILLKPVVVGQHTWASALKKDAINIADMQGDFSYKSTLDLKNRPTK